MIYFHVDDGAEQKQLAVPLSPPVCGLWGVLTPLLSPFISLLKPLSEAWLRGGGSVHSWGSFCWGWMCPQRVSWEGRQMWLVPGDQGMESATLRVLSHF